MAEDFFAHAPKLARAMDDPTADSSAFPIFMLARAAQEQGLKVVLSGEGADELFGGYKRYRRALWLFGLLPQKTRTRGVFSPFTPDNAALSGWRDGIARAEAALMNRGLSTLQGVQAVDCAEWLPNDLLLKLDRCLMAHSVEGRTPFLDVGFSPFAFGLSDDLKVRGNMGKWLLRDWLATNLPGADAWSKKKGFIPPNGQWIAQYKDRIEPLLLTHPALTAMGLQDAIRRVFSDPANNPQASWSLIFYALWYSHHILGVDASGTIEDVLGASQGLDHKLALAS